MNINLLSPTKNDNGFNYNVRFRENIKFKKNAKVYLNYATFSRESEVTFTEDQTITISDLQLLPELVPQSPAFSNNDLSTKSITIPRINPLTGITGYTFDNLQQVIEERLQDLLSGQNQGKIYTAFGEHTAVDLAERDVGIGFYIDKDELVTLKHFVADVTNNRQGGPGPDGEDYVKTSSNGSKANPTYTYGYDNYGLSDTHFFHPFVECGDDQSTQSLVFIEVNKSVADLTGAVTFGLYSEEYAANAGDNNADRTTGSTGVTGASANPQVINANTNLSVGNVNYLKGALGAFLTIEITPLTLKTDDGAGNTVDRGSNANSTIIRVAKSAVANTSLINSWTTINTNIKGMRQLRRYNNTGLANGVTSNHIKLCLKTYYSNDDGNLHTTNRRLYFQLINQTNGGSINNPGNIMYDSKTHGVQFPMAFFNGAAIAGSNAKKTDLINSRIPFNIIASAQSQNEGFTNIQYSEFDKSEGTSANPLSIIMNYKLNYSAELARYIGANNSPNLYPNTCEMKAEYIHIQNFKLDWLNDSYSILIKNLPIRNFKNTGTESNGGFGKAIIANIPTPFKDNVEQTLDNKKVLTGVYQPSYPVNLELNNPSEFELNNFDISIVNIRDETEVKDLIKSNVSFTII